MMTMPEDIINSLFYHMEHGTGRLITFSDRKRVETEMHNLSPAVKRTAAALQQQGFNHNHVLGIAGQNSLEWIIMDLACIYCGIRLLPVDPRHDDSLFYNEDFCLHALLLADEMYWHQVSSERIRIIRFSELLKSATTADGIRSYQYDNKDVFAYKTTSGSTGIPKVIGHSIESINNSIVSCQRLFAHDRNDRILVFLPLSLLQQRYWIYLSIVYGCTVIVVPKEYVLIAIETERPSVIMGIPYLYETLKENFSARLHNESILHDSYELFLKNRNGKHFEPFYNFLGGNIRYLWTGSAPISSETVNYYFAMGVPLYQGYGMNETCIITKNHPAANKIGSVGKPFPGIEISFDQDNQILIRNRFPVCGAYTIGSKNQNSETFLKDGVIATGDVGIIDEDGFLFISGRLKDVIVLAGSKKIFPGVIEQQLCLSKEIDQCVVYGDNKPYLVALIVPRRKIERGTIEAIVQQYNEGAREEEKVYRFHLIEERFSEEANLVSSQQKIKRKAIHQTYHRQLESLYL